MGEQSLDRVFSFQEYLELEQQDHQNRYEFVDGRVYAMAGGTIDHGLIIANTIFCLKDKVRRDGLGCKTFSGDVKVAVETANSYLYPDVFVVCDPIQEDKRHSQAIRNPNLIFEVLSKSTQNFDRTQKFRLYRSIPTFREYVMIEPDQPLIEVFYKSSDVHWEIKTYKGLKESLFIHTLNIEIPLRSFYEDVSWI